MTTSLPRVFGEIAIARTKKQKKELLLKYDCFALQQILKAAFDPNIKFLLPPGAPPIVILESCICLLKVNPPKI